MRQPIIAAHWKLHKTIAEARQFVAALSQQCPDPGPLEVVIAAPEPPDPFLALDDGDRSPLGRRLLAAKAAGLVITAETVRTVAQARTLAIAGFDRGGGPFAEAGLR